MTPYKLFNQYRGVHISNVPLEQRIRLNLDRYQNKTCCQCDSKISNYWFDASMPFCKVCWCYYTTGTVGADICVIYNPRSQQDYNKKFRQLHNEART